MTTTEAKLTGRQWKTWLAYKQNIALKFYGYSVAGPHGTKRYKKAQGVVDALITYFDIPKPDDAEDGDSELDLGPGMMLPSSVSPGELSPVLNWVVYHWDKVLYIELEDGTEITVTADIRPQKKVDWDQDSDIIEAYQANTDDFHDTAVVLEQHTNPDSFMVALVSPYSVSRIKLRENSPLEVFSYDQAKEICNSIISGEDDDVPWRL